MHKLKSILLIDDDAIANFLNEAVIKDFGIFEHIEVVTDGCEGMHYLSSHETPNLILLDLNMPVMNGFEFLQVYQKLGMEGKEKAKIIVLSSSHRKEDVKRALELGALDYIIKPLSELKLREVLERHFELEMY